MPDTNLNRDPLTDRVIGATPYFIPYAARGDGDFSVSLCLCGFLNA